MTIAIFTEPEVTNCFSKIALVIIRENKTKISETSTNLVAILKTEIRHCYKSPSGDDSERERSPQPISAAPFSIITTAILLKCFKMTYARTSVTEFAKEKISACTMSFSFFEKMPYNKNTY